MRWEGDAGDGGVVGVGGSVATMRGARLTAAEAADEGERAASGVHGRKAAESGMAGVLCYAGMTLVIGKVKAVRAGFLLYKEEVAAQRWRRRTDG